MGRYYYSRYRPRYKRQYKRYQRKQRYGYKKSYPPGFKQRKYKKKKNTWVKEANTKQLIQESMDELKTMFKRVVGEVPERIETGDLNNVIKTGTGVQPIKEGTCPRVLQKKQDTVLNIQKADRWNSFVQKAEAGAETTTKLFNWLYEHQHWFKNVHRAYRMITEVRKAMGRLPAFNQIEGLIMGPNEGVLIEEIDNEL